LDFLGQLAVFSPDLTYCEIPEEVTKAIREAVFESALLFFLDSSNNAATKQVPSFELPEGLL